MRPRFLFLALLLAPGLCAQTPATDETIRRFMEVSGGSAAFDATVGQWVELATKQVRLMIAQQLKSQGKPDAPDAFYQKFEQEFGVELRSQKQGLLDALVPIYRKHFSEEDLKQSTAFFESPAGKKFASRAPMVMQESMRVGSTWGEQNGEAMMRKVLGRMDLPELLKQP